MRILGPLKHVVHRLFGPFSETIGFSKGLLAKKGNCPELLVMRVWLTLLEFGKLNLEGLMILLQLGWALIMRFDLIF